MKRVQLVFPNTTEVWNFLTFNKMPTAEVGATTVQGFFAESEIEQACSNFGATVQDYVLSEVQQEKTEAPKHRSTAIEENITLAGKSGKVYKGTLYNKEATPATLPAQAIVCLSNSTFSSNGWHHAITAVYQTSNVATEMERFKARADISHLIVVPVNPAERSRVNKVDDLIRKYIHN